MQPAALVATAPDLGLAALVAGIAGLVIWFRRGTAPARPVAPTWWPLAAAVVLLSIAFFSPLARLASHQLLTAHLIQVTLVMGLAPPLILLSLPTGTTRRLPVWVGLAGRVVSQPVVALLLVNVVFFAWHATGPFNASLGDARLYALQQATLLLVSLAFWWSIVGPRASSRPGMSAFAKLGYILLATIPQTFAGMTVALARHPLYSVYEAAPRAFGLGVMSDQQAAGACMALVSKLALFTAFTIVFMRMLSERSSDEEDDHRERGDDGPIPEDPGPALGGALLAPGWLGLIETGDTVSEPPPIRTPAPVG